MLSFLTLMALAAETTVTISPTPLIDAWEGWGTSLAWMGKKFGERKDVADLFFSTKTVQIGKERLPGLGMNIVRYNAGACGWEEVDGRRMVVSKTILPYRQMEGFWVTPERWDWSVDKVQRTMMQLARDRGADRFELFSNSPMWWMCKNDNPSGSPDGSTDNLRPDQADNFAHYLAAIARHAQDHWGITFTTVEPFNEPVTNYWSQDCKQEGCHFSPTTQIDFLPRLRQALDRMGLTNMPIAASDETWVSQAITTWRCYDVRTRALVDQVNVHGYQGPTSPRVTLRKAVGKKKVWQSEHGENDRTGLRMATSIHRDITDLRATAWCYWQPLDGAAWGLLDADLMTSRIERSNPKHFVLAQYARHIRPGMQILPTGDTDTLAAYDPTRRKLVLVLRNGESESAKTIELAAFRKARGTARVWITEPKGTTRYARLSDLAFDGGKLRLPLPPNSIQTLEVSGVRAPQSL